VLAACGGGTTQEKKFVPGRLIVFGDETSLLTAEGTKYSVNALNTAGDAVDCAANALWVQTLATTFGLVFPQCNPAAATTTNGVMRAAAGARVDDLKLQIDAYVAAGGFKGDDLVTMLVGANDVLELYALYPGRSEQSLTDELRARGQRYAEQVNRVVGLGPRVIVSTVPDVGVTPYALAQKAAFTDTDRAALLARLSSAYNGRLRVGIINDGRLIGLVLADESVQVMAKAPAAFSLSNATDGACTVALPGCTTKTLVASGTATSHLWADATHMGYPGHLQVGQQALQRALNNPF
jgi:phospholipase/lecithinase/hemolysin